jgi:hypothetical protein
MTSRPHTSEKEETKEMEKERGGRGLLACWAAAAHTRVRLAGPDPAGSVQSVCLFFLLLFFSFLFSLFFPIFCKNASNQFKLLSKIF